MISRRVAYIGIGVIVCFFFMIAACNKQPEQTQGTAPEQGAGPTGIQQAQDQGIKILDARLSAARHNVDLRFLVQDPAKAANILDPKKKAYIIEQNSGKTLPVLLTKNGPMRQTTVKPEAGRVYFMLFSNAENTVQAGNRITLAIGEIRIRDIPLKGSPDTASKREKPPVKISDPRVKEWKAAREGLQKESSLCREHCGNDKACQDQCNREQLAKEKSEYARIIYGQ